MRALSYTLIRSQRKTVAIQITGEGEVLLRCPRRMPLRQAEAFLEQKRDWVEKQRQKILGQPQLTPFTEEEIEEMRKKAAEDLRRRVEFFAPIVDVTYGKITIRRQRSRWGSCSAQGNLSFNCLLMEAPEAVRDYIVVHELCHRREMNHSPKFWAEVARVLPDYRQRQTWLKENGNSLIRRLPEREC